MNTKETDYARIIGEFILSFGNLEKVIHNTIIIVCKELYSLDTAFLPIIDNMLCSMSSVNKKTELLEYIINISELSEEKKSLWQEFFSEIKELIQIRNLLAHNMYGVEDDKFIKFKKKKQKNGISIEVSKTYEELEKELEKLQERYRQLFDSVVEKEVCGDCTWICKHPKLHWK